jgi:hypothetical protein
MAFKKKMESKQITCSFKKATPPFSALRAPEILGLFMDIPFTIASSY